MRRWHLSADTRLAFWYHREEESGDVNPFFLQLTREILRHHGITQHHRDNGVVRARKRKARGGHFFAEQTGVSP